MSRVDYSWYEDRVEAFVDNELPEGESTAFLAQLKQDANLRQQVTAAHDLRARLRATSQLRCPPRVKAAILAETSRSHGLTWRWAMPVAAAAVMLVGVFIGANMNQQPSEAELAAARNDLAVALAYLDRAGRQAAMNVGEQVLKEGIIRPVQAGLDRGVPRRASAQLESEASS